MPQSSHAYRRYFNRGHAPELLEHDTALRHPVFSFAILGNLLKHPALTGDHEAQVLATIKALARATGATGVYRALKRYEQASQQARAQFDPEAPAGDDEAAPDPAPGLAREQARAALIAAAYAPGIAAQAGNRYEMLERALTHVAAAFGLDAVESDLLRLIVLFEFQHPARAAYHYLFEIFGGLAACYAALLARPDAEIAARLRAEATLRKAGLIDLTHQFHRHGSYYELSGHLRHVFAHEVTSPQAVVDRLIGTPRQSNLAADDFAHLGDVTQALARLLRQAGKAGETGINLLLHGRPGTGKTEYAHLLASLAGLPLYAVGETDSAGDEPTRRERMEAYKSFQHLMGRRGGDVLCLVDEAEDLFTAPGFFGRRVEGSKVFANRLFEQNPVPTIWIVNRSHDLP